MSYWNSQDFQNKNGSFVKNIYYKINLYVGRVWINKCYRIPKGQKKIENPEKLATQGTQDEDKQNKITYMLDTTIWKHK